VGLKIVPGFHKEKAKPDHVEQKNTGLKYVVRVCQRSVLVSSNEIFSFGTSAKNVIFQMTFSGDTSSL